MDIEVGGRLNNSTAIPLITQTQRARAKSHVRYEIRVPKELNRVELDRMYAVFAKYYNNHDKNIFMIDLIEKDHVILLRDARSGVIQGFSTLLKIHLKKYGINAIGIYSGDTVLEKEYWGTKALGMAFLTYLWREKVKNPFRPVYWLLISKGYKTYLLMANNFKTHFPRLDQSTPPKIKHIMDSFYADKFGDDYDRDKGLIEFDSASCCLKEKIAEISHELTKNPKVRFFAEKNPKWDRGHELACLAEMTLWLPLKYFLKKVGISKKHSPK